MSTISASELLRSSRIVALILGTPILIFGTLGVLLTILLFAKQHLPCRHPTTVYLLASAIMTAFHLPCIYLLNIVAHGFNVGLFNTNQFACQALLYLNYSTAISSIAFPCWAAFDQYASTCRQAAFRQRWSSIRVARLAIIGTILSCMIIYLPVIFIGDIIDGVCMLAETPYTKCNQYVLTPVVHILVPLLVVVVFTQGTLHNLHAGIARDHPNRLRRQIGRMLIPQLIVLSISGIPFGLISVYYEITRHVSKDEFRLALETMSDQIIRHIYQLNFVGTFYFYFFTSNKVKQALKKLLLTRFRQNTDVPMHTTRNNEIIRLTLRSLNGA